MTTVLPYVDSNLRYGSSYTKSSNIASIINSWERHMLSGEEKTLLDKTIELFKIMMAYSEFYRSYHNLLHLKEALACAEDICRQINLNEKQVKIVMAAIFFHDVVQHASPSKHSNERLSAQYAYDYLSSFSDIDVPTVRKLILGTENHRDEGEVGRDYDLQSIVNYADLQILAADEKRYAEYLEGIKNEYLAFDPEYGSIFRFYNLRQIFLQDILAKKRIYNPALDEKINLEEKARVNIKTELQVISEMNPSEEATADESAPSAIESNVG